MPQLNKMLAPPQWTATFPLDAGWMSANRMQMYTWIDHRQVGYRVYLYLVRGVQLPLLWGTLDLLPIQALA